MTAEAGVTRATPTPRTVLAGLVAALCALLLLKWIAVAALAALALYLALSWVVVRLARDRRGPEPAEPAEPVVLADPLVDCSWCGLAGGHHDLRGRPLRPRHAHSLHRVA